MIMQVRNNVKMRKTALGYEIESFCPYNNGKMYVHSVYGNRVRWVTDYTHAKQYSEAHAKRLVKMIAEGGVRV